MIINSSILSSSAHFHDNLWCVFPIEINGMPHAAIAWFFSIPALENDIWREILQSILVYDDTAFFIVIHCFVFFSDYVHSVVFLLVGVYSDCIIAVITKTFIAAIINHMIIFSIIVSGIIRWLFSPSFEGEWFVMLVSDQHSMSDALACRCHPCRILGIALACCQMSCAYMYEIRIWF